MREKMATKRKPKRKYTFRKGKIIPYESGSLAHILNRSEFGSRPARKRRRSSL